MKTCCCCPQAFPPARRMRDINVRKTALRKNIVRFPETSDICPSDDEPEARFVKNSNVLWVKETKGKIDFIMCKSLLREPGAGPGVILRPN